MQALFLPGNKIAVISVAGLAALVICITPGPASLGITGLAVFFLILCVFNMMQPYPELRRVLIIAFILRAALALVHSFITPLPASQTDAATFERVGWELARSWEAGASPEIITSSYLYSYLIGIVYYITERSPLLIQGINVLLGTLIVYSTGAIARVLFDSKVAAATAWIACLFPSLLLFSAITMRESLIIFCFSLFVLHFVHWLKSDRSQYLLRGTVCLFISGLLHTGILLLILIPVAFLLYDLGKSFFQGSVNALIIKIMAAVLICALLSIPLTTGAGMHKVGQLNRLTSVEYLEEFHRARAYDRAAYLKELSLSGPADLIILVPVKTLYFLFAPFPWQVSTPKDIAGVLDGLFYFLFTGLSCYGLYRVRRESGKHVFRGILLLLGAGIIIFAMGTANYGTALRHRAKFVFIMITLAGPALVYYRQKLGELLKRK